ncbi:MAG: hypothetical protein D6723_18085, partial [Acidobacteria bacterium]
TIFETITGVAERRGNRLTQREAENSPQIFAAKGGMYPDGHPTAGRRGDLTVHPRSGNPNQQLIPHEKFFTH